MKAIYRGKRGVCALLRSKVDGMEFDLEFTKKVFGGYNPTVRLSARGVPEKNKSLTNFSKGAFLEFNDEFGKCIEMGDILGVKTEGYADLSVRIEEYTKAIESKFATVDKRVKIVKSPVS